MVEQSNFTDIDINLEVNGTKVRDTVKYNTNGKTLSDDLLISEYQDINDQMMELNKHISEVSSKFAYWGILYASAKRREKEIKQEYKKWLADVKNNLANSGKKFTSEIAKEDYVITNNVDEYAKQQKIMIDAEYNMNVLEIYKDAFIMKKDMLITLSAQLRQEMSTLGLEGIAKWNAKAKQVAKI